ncbi:MAG: hypothetical protein IKZ87_01555 [Actinomycetaceae bacterium]|nr:hypothetical protein [Actinomycetaceae bacterium]
MASVVSLFAEKKTPVVSVPEIAPELDLVSDVTQGSALDGVPVVPGVDRGSVSTVIPVEISGFRSGVTLVGLHGGAGTSTLARLTGLRDGGHVWPDSGCRSVLNDVIVVARTSLDGLDAAQQAAQAAACGLLGDVRVIGAVFVADTPDRRALKATEGQVELVASGFPRSWRMGWVNGLRTREDKGFSRGDKKTMDELRLLGV